MQFTIQQLNNLFKNKLKNVYSNSEIQHLRFMVYETLLGVSKLEAITNTDKIIANDKCIELEMVAERLASNEPIQYILGETEFFGLRFKVSPSVLIPRPETEELVSWIINDSKGCTTNFPKSKNIDFRYSTPTLKGVNKSQYFSKSPLGVNKGNLSCTNSKTPKLRVLDIGTGSGCIAISLAKKLNTAEVFGLDISPSALEIAGKNATINNTTVTFIEQNIHKIEPDKLPNNLDILVSNPPYIRENEKIAMKANVLDYEPKLALFVTNHEPLLFYEKIAQLGKQILKKGGFLYFEINEAMGSEIENLLQQLNYKNIEIRKDFDGKNRMVKAIL